MNTSCSKLLAKGCQSQSWNDLASGNVTDDLIHLVAAFILASTTANLMGSRHALRYGVFCASLSIWRLSAALASVTTLSTLALAASGLSQYLRIAVTPEERSSQIPGQNSVDAVHQSLRQGSLNANESVLEDIPTCLPHYKSLFFPSRTTHRRLHPKPHAFNYSYLLVGVPVLRRPRNTNSMLSSHPTLSKQRTDQSAYLQSADKTAWFSVHASDYLQRSPAYSNFTLRAKLDMYLRSQGISKPENTFPYAYLVTAPQFLGFSFNPVSFWYLYNANQDLMAMILEVNNTFDERRMYFLCDEKTKSQEGDSGATTLSESESEKLKTARFTNKWKKDFHVSPFNDRDGTYSVSATDILRTGQLDVTIVLSDDSNNENNETVTHPNPSDSATQPPPSSPSAPARPSPKIIARIYTPASHPPISPITLSPPQQLLFTIRHGLTGFLTNPRILLEARKLWTMGLTVFYRPEPLDTTVPRVEMEEEMVIEGRFRGALGVLARQNGVDTGVRIEYVAAAGVDRGVEVEVERTGNEGEERSELEQEHTQSRQESRSNLKIHVLTPTFYTELAKSPDDLKTIFDKFGFNAPKKEQLVDCSSAELLKVVLEGNSDSKVDVNGLHHLPSKSEEKTDIHVTMLQGMINWLRTPLSRDISSLSSFSARFGASLSTPMSSSWSMSMSPFDHLVHTTSTTSQYRAYLRVVLLILLADRFALGSMGLLRFEIRILRFMAVLTAVNVGKRVTESVSPL